MSRGLVLNAASLLRSGINGNKPEYMALALGGLSPEADSLLRSGINGNNY